MPSIISDSSPHSDDDSTPAQSHFRFFSPTATGRADVLTARPTLFPDNEEKTDTNDIIDSTVITDPYIIDPYMYESISTETAIMAAEAATDAANQQAKHDEQIKQIKERARQAREEKLAQATYRSKLASMPTILSSKLQQNTADERVAILEQKVRMLEGALMGMVSKAICAISH